MKTFYLIALLIPSLALGAIYERIDANGHATYSDTPFKHSKKLRLGDDSQSDIKNHLTYVSSTFEKVKNELFGDNNNKQNDKLPNYKTLQILSPKAEQTFWNATDIAVNVEPNPKLMDEHNIQLFLDNTPLEKTDNTGQFNLKNLHRGEHTVKAVIVDASGNQLLASAPVKFFVHRKTAQQHPSTN